MRTVKPLVPTQPVVDGLCQGRGRSRRAGGARWILARLRNRRFFSLAELNQAIALLLGELNDKPMAAPREGSRRSLFEAVERGALKRCRSTPTWSATGQSGQSSMSTIMFRSIGTSTPCPCAGAQTR